MKLRYLAAGAAVVVALSACNGWPDTPQGNSIGLADSQVGQTRATHPPYDLGGTDCWAFVNWVETTAGTPGWTDAQGPGTYSSLLQADPAGVQPGDIVVFADAQFPSTPVHVGIVYAASPGSFGSVEWNSEQNPNAVVINYHPNNSIPDPATNLVLVGSYLP